MKLRELLDKWSLTKLRVNAGFLDAEFQANDQEKDAAWAMYVELLTRITTQALPAEQGDEAAALASVHQLFAITRDILRSSGARHADKFAKIAIVVLNQKVRPFTSHWHKAALAGCLRRCGAVPALSQRTRRIAGRADPLRGFAVGPCRCGRPDRARA